MPVRFHDETEYTFDCAVECGELTNDVPLFLKCFFPGDPYIEHLMTLSDSQMKANRRHREGITPYLTRMITERCDELIATGNYDRQIFTEIIFQSLHSLSMQAHEMSHMVARDLAHTLTEFGERLPRKRMMARVQSPAHQRKFLRSHAWTNVFVERAKRLVALTKREMHNGCKWYVDEDKNVSFARLDDAIKAYHRLPRPRSVARQAVAPTKEKRKMLKRATRLATSLVGEHAVYEFLRGKPVYVMGKDFTYKTEMRDPFSTGHGSTAIQVCDNELNPLADLCVYFKDAPALDHLAALKMNCDVGLDADVLYDANVTRVFPAAKTNAMFQAVREVKRQDNEMASKLRTLNRYMEEMERRSRIEDETEVQKKKIEVGGISVEIEVPQNDRAIAAVREDAVIQGWINCGSAIAISNTTLPTGTCISMQSRIHRITDGVGTQRIVWNSASTNATSTTVGTTSVVSTGTGGMFYVTGVVNSNTPMMITWNMPMTPEQRKQNSKFMRLRENDNRSHKVRPTMDRRKKNQFWNKRLALMIPGTYDPRLSWADAVDKWGELFAAKFIQPQMCDHVFMEISKHKPKLARTLAAVGASRSAAMHSGIEARMYEDMLRDDDGNLPMEQHAPELADQALNDDPAQAIDTLAHMQQHRMQLAAVTVARTIRRDVAAARAQNGEAEDVAGDHEVAVALIENALQTEIALYDVA